MPVNISTPQVYFGSMNFNGAPEIRRTQRTLLLLLSIVFGIYLISFIGVIYSLSTHYRTNAYEPIILLVWILFFASGILFTQKYSPIGLLVFAWLNIINIIIKCILIVLVMVGIVLITSEPYRQDTEVQITVIPVIICLASIILDAVVTIFSFNLSGLIIKYRRPQNLQRF